MVDKFDAAKFNYFTTVLIPISSLLFGFIEVNVVNEVSNMLNTRRKLYLFFILTALTACGGGGGGGGGGGSPVITTTSINNATFNSTSTNNFGYNGVTAISALTNTPTSTTNTSTLTYSGSNITKAVVVGPDGALITFDTNLGDTIATTQAYGGVLLVGAIKQNQQEQILIANFPSSTKSKIVNHNKIVGSKMYHSVSLQATPRVLTQL